MVAQQYPIAKGSTVDFLTGIFKIDDYPTDKEYSYMIGYGYKAVSIEKGLNGYLYKTSYYRGFQNSYSSLSDFLDKNPEQKFYLDSLKLTGEHFTSFGEYYFNKQDRSTHVPYVKYYNERDGYYVTGRNMDIFYRKNMSHPTIYRFYLKKCGEILSLRREEMTETIFQNFLSLILEM